MCVEKDAAVQTGQVYGGLTSLCTQLLALLIFYTRSQIQLDVPAIDEKLFNLAAKFDSFIDLFLNPSPFAQSVRAIYVGLLFFLPH